MKHLSSAGHGRFLLLLIVVTLGIFGIQSAYTIPRVQKTIQIGEEVRCLSNDFQLNSEAVCWEYNGEFYFYGNFMESYSRWICKLEGSKVKRIKSLKKYKDSWVIGASGQYVYYYFKTPQTPKALYEMTINCYDLETGEDTTLVIGVHPAINIIGNDGMGNVFISTFDLDNQMPRMCLKISGKTYCGEEEYGTYYAAGKQYWLQFDGSNKALYSCDLNGETHRENLCQDSRRAMIIHAKGAVVNSFWGDGNVYNIDVCGDMTTIFAIPSDLYTKTAVCIVGDQLFFSCARYETYGQIGACEYEDDELSGTYRIDLSDYSSTKINDMFFCGMYCFDGKCIYGVVYDHNITSIYEVSFDGGMELIFNPEQQIGT